MSTPLVIEHLDVAEQVGFRAGDAPWESYVTDPAEHPDPKDWRTEVYWPMPAR